MSRQELTKNISIRISAKDLHKLDQMVEKFSAMNRREMTRSDLIKQAVAVFIHNNYQVLRKPKSKKSGIKDGK